LTRRQWLAGGAAVLAIGTVYTHPTTAGIDDAHIEFGADTARSIFSVIFSGTSQKSKDVNWIWSHGGAALTAFSWR